MKKHLFLFTISPVQAFITQARKAQDLYAGSLILSELMKKVHAELKKSGAEIIFPQLTSEKSSATHRILAIIENTNTGTKLEQFVKDEFIKIAKSIKLIASNFNNCENQLNDFLQVYWVAKEIENNEFNYSEIERLLGSVKNVRAFEQLDEPGGRKCSLCGERNVVFYKPNYRNDGQINTPAFIDKTQSIKIDKNNHSLNQGEGLCAVCTTKRFYDTKISFPSTAEIAQYDLKKELENSESYKQFKNIFQKDFDFQLLYKENHTEKYFEKHGIKVNSGGLKFSLEIYNKIKFVSKQKKYYALIRFDGDSMGKLMAGDLLKDENKHDLKVFQIKVSKLLSEYASWATEYLKEPYGKAIFAGGDDFLGFVNLHHLFDVLAELRHNFDFKVNKKIRDKITQDFTFSAGVTIAHYKTPLHAVLERTRKMEHDAKQVDKKDAFAIAVMKHSGEIHETVLKWKNDENENAKSISFILENLKNGNFSSTFIQSMNVEFLKLLDEEGKTTLNDDLIKTELKRLLNRAKKNGLEKEKVQELAKNIFSLYQGNNLKDLLSLLSICDFIIRKTN